MKKDFTITFCNTENSNKEIDVWSLIEERKDFTISHIKIYCNIQQFYYKNAISLGEKTYLLHNYLTQDNSTCLIYDFSRNYLSPLNVVIKEDDTWIINVDSFITITVSIAVL